MAVLGHSPHRHRVGSDCLNRAGFEAGAREKSEDR